MKISRLTPADIKQLQLFYVFGYYNNRLETNLNGKYSFKLYCSK